MTALLLIVVLAGCSRSGSAPQRESSPPTRVVVLAPNLAEIVSHIGAAGLLVGISSYGAVPEGASGAQRVGGFTDPSIEAIIALEPDLVVGVPLQAGALESCRRAGLRVVETNCDSIDQALAAYDTLGTELGHVDGARRARQELEGRLTRVRQRTASLERRPRTLFLLGLAGEDLRQVFPVGPGNFGDELLRMAGGDNVLTAASPTISAESVIQLAPEVVIEVAMDSPEGTAEGTRLPQSPFWGRLGQGLPAVARGRVYTLSSSSLLVPGPRMAAGAELLADLLHGGS